VRLRSDLGVHLADVLVYMMQEIHEGNCNVARHGGDQLAQAREHLEAYAALTQHPVHHGAALGLDAHRRQELVHAAAHLALALIEEAGL
jgi:hypothetical protein